MAWYLQGRGETGKDKINYLLPCLFLNYYVLFTVWLLISLNFERSCYYSVINSILPSISRTQPSVYTTILSSSVTLHTQLSPSAILTVFPVLPRLYLSLHWTPHLIFCSNSFYVSFLPQQDSEKRSEEMKRIKEYYFNPFSTGTHFYLEFLWVLGVIRRFYWH